MRAIYVRDFTRKYIIIESAKAIWSRYVHNGGGDASVLLLQVQNILRRLRSSRLAVEYTGGVDADHVSLAL